METKYLCFKGLKELCNEHIKEIMDEGHSDLSYLLERRRVRYIDPFGHFGYTTFGQFYFSETDVMMIVTKDDELTRYHRSDILKDSLMSTVPVIYAGIETGLFDVHHQSVFTGDVIKIKEEWSTEEGMVRWSSGCKYPGIMGDNCDYILERNEPFDIIGNVFVDIVWPEDYEWYSYYKYIDNNPVFSGRVTQKYYNGILEKIKKAPYFKDDRRPERNQYHLMYLNSIAELNLREMDILLSFGMSFFGVDDAVDLNDALDANILFVNRASIPDFCRNKCIIIDINPSNPDWKQVEENINDLLLSIHSHPEIKYALCDLNSTLLREENFREIVRIFKKADEYHLGNLSLPFCIMNEYLY